MPNCTCIIIDDEIQSRKLLTIFIEKMEKVECTGTFNSALSASKYLKDNSVDIILTDINMPGQLGTEFARTVNKNTAIIFTTAHLTYALEAFEIEAIDYLVKPITFNRLQKAIQKAIKRLNLRENAERHKERNESFIFLKKNNIQHRVFLSEILFIKADDDYVVYTTDTESFMIKKSLKLSLKELDCDNFIQVHKSYIINLQSIIQLKSNTIYIKNHEIPVGRVYKKELQKRIQK